MGIAEQLGAHVHLLAWTDESSAARNAALDYSSAQSYLVLDADEWIDAVAGKAVLDTALAGPEPFL